MEMVLIIQEVVGHLPQGEMEEMSDGGDDGDGGGGDDSPPPSDHGQPQHCQG